MRFDLNLLLLFDAMMQMRSVSAAARKLGVGQPAASAALARLRTALGDPLFVRAGSTMQPTPRAERLAPVLRESLAQLQSAFDEAAHFDPTTADAEFALAHSDYTALVTLPALLQRVRAEAPNVRIRIVSFDKDEVTALLSSNAADVAVGVFPNPPPDAVATPLFEDSFVGVAARDNPALAGGRLDAAAFAALPHALVTLRRDSVGWVDARLAERGLKRRVAVVVPYMMALGAALAGTDLVAAAPRRAVAAMADANLRTFELPFPAPPWTVSLAWQATRRGDPALTWLRRTIKDAAPL